MQDTQPRRLSDKIVAAHRQACDQGKAEVARCLLQALELELSAHGGVSEQRALDAAIAEAYARQRRLDDG
jgi:hypothetical protein